jgi:hypothetical protein
MDSEENVKWRSQITAGGWLHSRGLLFTFGYIKVNLALGPSQTKRGISKID